jgi:protein TonB
MFDLIVNGQRNTAPRDIVPLAISWAVHTLGIGAVVVLPLLFATDHLPVVPKEVLTYVTVAAPPPPPAAAPTPAPAVKRPSPRPTATPRLAPVVVPRELPPSIEVADDDESASDFDSLDGIADGVEGGVPGGVLGGIIGGITQEIAPPPPPPAPRAAVRTGGQIQAPALVKRVAPVYPSLAARAKVEGVVILEATVGRDGRVEDVEVLRSVPLLDRAAIDAVRQWVYNPLMLNGQAERFILTVTVSFNVSLNE